MLIELKVSVVPGLFSQVQFKLGDDNQDSTLTLRNYFRQDVCTRLPLWLNGRIWHRWKTNKMFLNILAPFTELFIEISCRLRPRRKEISFSVSPSSPANNGYEWYIQLQYTQLVYLFLCSRCSNMALWNIQLDISTVDRNDQLTFDASIGDLEIVLQVLVAA